MPDPHPRPSDRAKLRDAPSTREGERIYAIGDVHGRLDLLQVLTSLLEKDVEARDACATRVIFLGDLIDRGPYSKQVLEFLCEVQAKYPEVVVLCGNHEELLLESIAGNPQAQSVWLANGGDATLTSYGLDPSAMDRITEDRFAYRLKEAVGENVLRWLEGLPVSVRSGDYFFCHAGIRPGIAIDEQRRNDLLWIRREFLASTLDHGAVIVHGHSEEGSSQVLSNRISVDTAAYRTGQLTAVGLQGSSRWFVATNESG